MHGDMTWLAMADPMVWFFALNALDVLLTLYVLRNGGIELNRVLVKWFARDDADVVLVRVKVALLCLVWLMSYFGGIACSAWPMWATCSLPDWALGAFVAGYAGLAAWNLRSVYNTWKRMHP